ncbi:MAG: 2-dehydropantoate 2-reductase [Anaerolineae bacterium]|nr:2-dehydropantoate 2-reductase [Anaerolineae bacterium]
MTFPSTVVILGAGAMGAAFASALYEMDPASVAFVARGERYDRLKADGITVNGKHYPFRVIQAGESAPPADLVIVALKQHQLADALPDLRGCVGENTLFLSVMNGLDSEPLIGEMYGPERVLYAVSVGIDAQRPDPGTVYFSKLGTIIFGEPVNDPPSDRVRQVQALFDRAGIDYDTPADMIRMMWWKLMINVGVNQTSSILGAPYGVMQTNRDAQAIMEAAMREVIACAQAEQVNLSENDLVNWYPILNTLHPEARTSMLQDVEAGRKTEVEIFAGKIVAFGQKHGIPTPVNELLLHAIHVLESRAR